MSAPMPSDGPRREIFLRALREYSDRCELPDLTPTCPFYRSGPNGVWCLDECHEILSDHPEPPPAEQLVLSPDLAARPRRPRARHGCTAPTLPYDARQVLIEDKDRPIAEWRPAALILQLLEIVVGSPPPDNAALHAARTDRVLELIEALDQQAFDTRSLVREALVPPIALGIIWSAALPLTRVAGGNTNDPLEVPPPPHGWVSVLLGGERSFEEWIAYAEEQGPTWANDQLGKVWTSLPRVFSWLAAMDIGDLANWRAPSTLDFGAAKVSVETMGQVSRWVVERFTVTYLDRWATSSLHLEWEYLHGRRIAPCHVRSMQSRHVTEHDLAVAIAHKAVFDPDGSSPADMIPVDAFRTMVVDHLRSGRRWAGAAIYDAARRASPNHAEAHNNHGFCLLPDDPAAALPSLERAAELGMENEPVNVANRMLALKRTDRPTSALELAESFAQRDLLRVPRIGWLWDYDADEPVLIDVPSTSEYIAGLALRIAEDSNDLKAAEVWRRRLEGTKGTEQ